MDEKIKVAISFRRRENTENEFIKLLSLTKKKKTGTKKKTLQNDHNTF